MSLEEQIIQTASRYKRRRLYKNELYRYSEQLAKTLINRGFYQFKYLSSGFYASVFDIGKGCILRMSYEKPYQFPPKAPFNERIGQPFKLSPNSEIYFEIYQKLEIVGKLLSRKTLDPKVKRSIENRYKELCFHWEDIQTLYGRVWDVHENNVGITPSGQLVITDPGCLRNGKKAKVYVVN
jgi:hypothetical protein